LRRLLALTMMILFLVPTSTEAATLFNPEIQDIAGDSNAINWLLEESSTNPVSYAPADLTSVDFQTAYEPVPVGDDGIHFQPTALRVVFTASGSPGDIAPGGELVFQASGNILPNTVYLEGTVSKSASGVVTATARLRREDWDCDEDPSLCWERSDPEWSALVDVDKKTLTLTYPFASLAADEANIIGVNRILWGPEAHTLQLADSIAGDSEEVLIDSARWGHLFIVGEDVPQDVNCTQSCEAPSNPCAAQVGISDNNQDAITFRATVNGACKSPDEVHSVELTITSRKCTNGAPCSDERFVVSCAGRKCGTVLRIPYLYPETATYRIRADWEFDDGDSDGFGWTICHPGLGVQDCPDSGNRLIGF
jgi:hypothetical protein